MRFNIKKSKIIFTTCIIACLIIIINPSISAINYIQIENTINNESTKIETYLNILDNGFLILILDLIILILQSIFIITIFFVEDIIDTIWELIEQIEDPFIKQIWTLYNLIIEGLWYISLGFYFPIIILVYILDAIRDSIEPTFTIN